MPGLLRGIARTAVVAGTATAVSNRVSRRQGERWAQQGSDQDSQPEPGDGQTPPRSNEAPSGRDPIDQLKELAALKDQGVLTDAEFTAQKTKILNA